MESAFELRFLGTIQAFHHGLPLQGFRSRKALALLGYLAVQRRPTPREQLVALFWESQPEESARANLSWVLNRIATLLPGCLLADRHTVELQRSPAYRIDTDNDLIGGQYGAEFLLPLFGRLLITTRLKAGVYLNAAEQETQIIDSAILRLATKDTDDEVAVVGEINVGVNFKVNHILSVRGGYNFLWVDGLALAAEQGYPVGLTGVAPINDNGGLFYHGFNVGVQVSR